MPEPPGVLHWNVLTCYGMVPDVFQNIAVFARMFAAVTY